MADLESLIRLRKHEVEERQKLLSEIYRRMEALENQKLNLQQKLERERKALDDNMMPEAYAYYGRFEGAVRNDIDRLTSEIQALEQELSAAQEHVRAAFEEQKRVEIVHQRRNDEKALVQKSKEAQELDDIGIEGFRRKKED